MSADRDPTLSGRRALLAGAAALLAAPVVAPVVARAQQSITVTDLLGRVVTVPRPARRVVLLQGRHIAVLNLLLPDPAAVLVGWSDDWKVGAVDEMRAYAARFPALNATPVIAKMQSNIDGEKLLTLQPDLVVFSRSDASRDGQRLFPLLEAGGIPAVTIDFFLNPLRDTVPSLRILGKLLGRDEQAEALIAFHQRRLSLIEDAMRGLEEAQRPWVMMHAHAGGTPCCFSPGRGTLDAFIELAGGRNLGALRIATPTGQLSLEYVLTAQPEVYVATGGSYNGRGGVEMGAGIAEAASRASLRRVIHEQKLDDLPAVERGRAYGLWHGCNDSPAHVLAIEALASWIQPNRTSGLDPAASLAELNQRFAAVPMSGTYWVSAVRPG